MPTEAETGKPVAKTKEQIEADFKRRHKYGLQLSEIKGVRLKGGAAKKDSTDTKPSK
jgi:hypothetical protein